MIDTAPENKTVMELMQQRKRKRSDSVSRFASGQKWCVHHSSYHGLEAFGRDIRAQDGLTCSCKAANAERRNNEVSFLANLVQTMKLMSKRRRDHGRGPAGHCDFTLAAMQELLSAQNQKCDIAEWPMSTMRLSHWKVSPDRIDNNQGEIVGNVRLVCLEFQNREEGWSKEKLHELYEKSKAMLCIEYLELAESSLQNPPKKANPKSVCKQIEGKVFFLCFHCDEFHSADRMQKGSKTLCKVCDYSKRRESIYVEARHLLNSARGNSKRRNVDILRRGAVQLDFDINLENVLCMIRAQGFRCYYSNVPFQFASLLQKGELSDKLRWMSLERKDPKKGYTTENCCLVIRAFQGLDHSRAAKHSNGGSGGWSRAKVLRLFSWLECKQKGIKFDEFDKSYQPVTTAASHPKLISTGLSTVCVTLTSSL